jgi:CheY-like chemotaxis protein
LTYKLLLADDSVTIQRVIELTFADEDFQVIAVGDGQSAIDRAEAELPDIVLADVDMPKRDGYEVASFIKDHPKLRHVPVVLLTGAFEPIDQARAAAAGSTDVLSKPFEPQMLIARVKQLLDARPAPAPQPIPAAAPQLPPATATPAKPRTTPSVPAAPEISAPPEPVPADLSLDSYFSQLHSSFSRAPVDPAADHDTLHAEQDWVASQAIRSSTPSPAAVPPASPASSATPAPVGDDLIEQIVSRVLQRLSDRVIRETVSDIVTRTAERLVQEEIRRIKAEAR